MSANDHNHNQISLQISEETKIDIDCTHIRPDHTTSLHTHVIQRRRHRPRSHGSRIPTRDGYDNRVHIRRSDKQRAQRPFHPRPRLAIDSLQRDEDRQRPNLADETGQEALIRLLRHPRPEQQLHDEEHVRGYGEQVRFERAEAGGFELQGQVRGHWVVWDQPGEAEEVDGPHVVVCEAVPERFRGQGLPVVHVAFAGVVAEDAVDHDGFLALAEPAFFAPEPAPGLGWGRRQV